jgi:enoyl-CoA hydratase/carnithine racemase
MPEGRIHLKIDGAIATVVIDNPVKRNALDSAMRAGLLASLRQADANPAIRVIRVTGTDGAFCSGGDLNYLQGLKSREDEASFNQLLDDGNKITDLLRKSAKPTIAVVNGPALAAGFFIALACDLRVCGENAAMGVPLARIGLGPDWGCTHWLPRITGTAKALEILLTGEILRGEDVLRFGLANRMWPDSELETKSLELAQRIASYPAPLLARLKSAVYSTWTATPEETAEVERRLQLQNFKSPNVAEGIAAFLEKRPPKFS